MRKLVLTMLLANIVLFSFGQKHCKCEIDKIERKQDGDNGSHNEILNGLKQRPITTFSRDAQNAWYHPDSTQTQNLSTLRLRLNEAKSSKDFEKLYNVIWSQAQNPIVPYTHVKKGNNEGNNAKTAKAAAFCLVANFNGSGTVLTSTEKAMLKSKVVDAIMRFEYRNDDDYFDDLIPTPWTFIGKKFKFDGTNKERANNYTGSHYWFSKALVMLLEAYDLAAAVYENDAQLDSCSKILHCVSTNYFEVSTATLWGVGLRNDNHSLMSAGAIGLASVVLGEQTVKSWNRDWQPDVWAKYAHWRIIKTLWDLPSDQYETISTGTYGFAEGPHYFRFSFENLLPFFLAYKNGNPNDTINEFVKPEATSNSLFVNSVSFYENYWNSRGLKNLMIWNAEMALPNGNYIIKDDTWLNKDFLGALMYRDQLVLKNIQSINFSSLDNRFVDFRVNIAAALAETNYSFTNPMSNSFSNLAGGDIVLKNVNFGSSENLNRNLTFYLNAEKSDLATMYLPKIKTAVYTSDAHEQEDAMSFLLATGSKYLMVDAGYNGGTDHERYDDPWQHNTVFLADSNSMDDHSVSYRPIKEGSVVVKNFDFNNSEGEVTIFGEFEDNVSNLTRTVEVIKVGNSYFYVIKDEVYSPTNSPIWVFKGNGRQTNNSFRALEDTFIWKGNCDYELDTSNTTVNMKVMSVFDYQTGKQNFSVTNADSFYEHGLFANYYNRSVVMVKNHGQIRSTLITKLYPFYCRTNLDKIRVSAGDNSALFALKSPNMDNKAIVGWDRNNSKLTYVSFELDSPKTDTFFTNAKVGRIGLNMDTNYLGCYNDTIILNSIIEKINLSDFDTFNFNEVDYIISTNRLQSLRFYFNDIYKYSGKVVSNTLYDTIQFYLPNVPPTNLSLMTEQTGLNYSYDTTTQKITLYLPDSGTYNFAFGPSNPCAVSCFYPPDSIYYHFEHSGSSERLGHILDIKTDSGWLAMRNAARMNICSKAVLNNLDSLTLSSNTACNGNTSSGTNGQDQSKGFASHYFNSEGNKYRQSYRIGSGAGLSTDGESGTDEYTERSRSKRTMIIVENEGALVLKSGSHTVVGNGSTILVKPGGTLKIEANASLVIGSHDSIGCGFGEVIIMDSAFLCASSQANISFYEDERDSIDKHIFFISMNPDSGAREGIAPTSNVPADTVVGNNCTQFCEFPNTFNPPYGINNYKHGWLNVGKPFAWLQDIGVVCYGQDVYANGLYSLNETRHRFEVCKWNSSTQNCIGATDTIPINDTDNYYGGRLQGKVNLSELYIANNNGSGFERGNDYRIKFIIENDCGLSDEITKIVELPGQLSAVITGDTLICGGDGAITVNGSSSTGDIDSFRWEVWRYKPFPEYDSATYYANADTFVSFSDTFWLDSVTIDTVVVDTFWFYKTDTIDNDSFHYAKYYKEYWDTTIVATSVGSYTFNNIFFHSASKYSVLLTLYNQCGISTDTLIIRTKDGPEVSAGPDKYIAYGTPSSPDPELEGSVGGTATSYVWSPTSGLSSASVLDPTATPSSTTTYVLSATDADGCTNYDSVLVFVNTIANAGRDTTICYSDSIQVGAALGGSYTYEWSPANLVSNATIAQPYAYLKAFGTTYLKLQVYSSGSLVGIDDVVIYKDTLDSITFDINPAAMFFDASFGVYHTPVSANDISWDFDDGTGSYTSMGTNFTYSFPNTPSTIYDVCASFTNACGTQASCKDCEFDMMGNVIPKPPTPISVAEPKMENKISVWPNPFTDITVLEYSLSENNNAQIEIIDLNGKMIKTIRINDNSGKVELNLSQQAEGVYQYRFINGNEEIENGKLVLIK